MTESKKSPTATGAKKGKVRGAAQVTPKPADQEAQDSSPKVAPDTRAGEDTAEAYKAGYKASQQGHPTRPSIYYTEAEVKEWYRGYKAHANPQTGGPVDGITGGYRGDY